MPKQIPFIDLQAQRRRISDRIDSAIQRVLEHGQFILGPEIVECERRLTELSGSRYAISCSSGTDALMLPLMAWGIGPGDAVFVPAFTFVATAEVVALVHATPIFVDVLDDTFNIDPARLDQAIVAARAQGLRPKAVIPVDLFGQPADYDAILPIATKHKLKVLCDAAQSFGARYRGRPVGSIGDATATSFFPSKPLGCYGDGGAIFTDNAELAAGLSSLRGHGQGSDRYEHVRIGMNGRFDSIQAAILIEKMAIFPEEIVLRDAVASRYTAGLRNLLPTPRVIEEATSVWAQYTLRTGDRDRLVAALKAAGVPTAVHYPIPLNEQPAYRHFSQSTGGFPVSQALSRRVCSLPMHPYLGHETQDVIIDAIKHALK